MFAAKYQLKRVTVAILNYASFNIAVLCCLMNMNRTDTSFKQCFYQNNKMFYSVKITTRVRMLSFGIDTATQSNTMFDASIHECHRSVGLVVHYSCSITKCNTDLSENLTVCWTYCNSDLWTTYRSVMR